jgi:hypothetical protein
MTYFTDFNHSARIIALELVDILHTLGWNGIRPTNMGACCCYTGSGKHTYLTEEYKLATNPAFSRRCCDCICNGSSRNIELTEWVRCNVDGCQHAAVLSNSFQQNPSGKCKEHTNIERIENGQNALPEWLDISSPRNYAFNGKHFPLAFIVIWLRFMAILTDTPLKNPFDRKIQNCSFKSLFNMLLRNLCPSHFHLIVKSYNGNMYDTFSQYTSNPSSVVHIDKAINSINNIMIKLVNYMLIKPLRAYIPCFPVELCKLVSDYATDLNAIENKSAKFMNL